MNSEDRKHGPREAGQEVDFRGLHSEVVGLTVESQQHQLGLSFQPQP